MCFSASASFGASAVLSVAGVASLVYSRTLSQKALAGIPIIFAIQQFTEGVVWMSLMHTEWAQWQTTASYAFLVFAQMVWPIYIPFAMLVCEREPARRKAMYALLLAGFTLSGYIGFCLYKYSVLAVVDKHHIRYDLGFALAHTWYYGLLYFLPTIVSPVISSIKRLHWLGYLFLLSYIAARLLFHYFEISVWCFFGALISLIVFVIIRGSGKKYTIG
jgi:hypothetical protein